MELQIKRRALFLGLPILIFIYSCGRCRAGQCLSNQCSCPSGFWGAKCQFGRERLIKKTGSIYDQSGDYVSASKMYWFIDSQRKNTSIEIELDTFATECAWDHVYIYDGWSIFDPLIAALSGDIQRHGNQYNDTARRKIIAKSGNALVHFYSDQNLNDEGFNLTYRISNCTNETCSGHGYCNSSSICECEAGWTGKQCSILECCPNEKYNIVTKTNFCPNVLTGSSCPMQVSPRASHAAVIDNDQMWIYGGYNFDNSANNLQRYDLTFQKWSIYDRNPALEDRFGHTMVVYNKKLFIFGGIKGKEITNELWEFDISTKTWGKLTVNGKTPIAVTGHAAVTVANQMYVFLGYSSEKSYCNSVQQLNLDTMEWKILKTTGALVTGTFGHTAVYDRISDLIFVHGGYSLPVDSVEIKKKVTGALLSFSPTTKSWTVLPGSGSPRMLHTSAILGRILLVFGGANHYHEDMKKASDKKCYSHDILAYNIDCKVWKKIDSTQLLHRKGRFGSASVSYNRTMFVFGGFDGVLLNDLLPITIGHCSSYKTRTQCLQAPFVSNCVWDKVTLHCLEAEKSSILPSSQTESPSCNATVIECKSFRTCKTCLSNSINCSWCDKTCGDVKCSSNPKVKAVNDVSLCPSAFKFTCASFSTCYSCEQHPNCTWRFSENRGTCQYSVTKENFNASSKCNPFKPSESQCHLIKTCSSCTAANKIGCMWCQSQNLCIDSEAYFINFPYGQCLEWINNEKCSDVVCSAQKTCHSCFKLPDCGWCADSSGTGIGKCMKGANLGPFRTSNSSVCPAARWYYTECPSCQCNGHSQCQNGSTCTKCMNNTSGLNCEKCRPGYFGMALNNGTCKACVKCDGNCQPCDNLALLRTYTYKKWMQECFCSGHGLSCDSTSGKCDCNSEGLVGDHCDRCDYRSYVGNATKGGHCFYQLQFGYQYSFNKTNKNRNFFAIPSKADVEIKFGIIIRRGSRAYMNFSQTVGGKEEFIVKKFALGVYTVKFPVEQYKIKKNLEPIFKVYLYNISKDAGLMVSLEQISPNSLNWLHFLIVFLICFCSLLIILIVVWKLKQQYSNYQYNRRRRVELREMASRPFSSVTLCCGENLDKHRKVEPTQVGLEPFVHGHVAVASVFIELPRSEKGFSPKGQSGLCIGSTLVVHRHQKIILTAQQQLYIFKGRQKRHQQTAVNV